MELPGSLPSRERGLKCTDCEFTVTDEQSSLPSRERGLKLCLRALALRAFSVAPFAGAWIEISWCCPAF